MKDSIKKEKYQFNRKNIETLMENFLQEESLNLLNNQLNESNYLIDLTDSTSSTRLKFNFRCDKMDQYTKIWKHIK